QSRRVPDEAPRSAGAYSSSGKGGSMRIVDLTAGLNLPEVDKLLAPDDIEQSVEKAVSGILQDVRKRGDAAVCDYTKRFDEFNLTPDLMRVPDDHIQSYAADADDELVRDAHQVRCQIK